MNLSKYRCLMAASALLVCCWTANGAPRPKRLLVVYGRAGESAADATFDRGVRNAIGAAGPAVQYVAEYLEIDPAALASDERLPDHLRDKYGRQPVDAIIAASSASLEFLRQHRDDLFAGVPIVFRTVERPVFDGTREDADITGVTGDGVIGKTLQTALDLQPDAKRVVVLTGVAAMDALPQAALREALVPFERLVRFTYTADASPAGAAAAGSGDVSFILDARDRDAPEAPPASGQLASVSLASAVPVFAPSAGLIGRGSIGGYVTDAEEAGRVAGRMALRIMNGTPPADIPIASVRSTPTFDWRELRKWNVSEDRLPAGSVVLFRAPTLANRLGRPISLALLAGVEVMLVAALLVQVVSRRRVEHTLRDNEQRYRSVMDMQTDLVCRFMPDTTLTFVNDAYCRFWGRTRASLIGTKFLDLTPAGTREEVRAVRGALGPGEFSHEHEVMLADGTIGWHHWTNLAITDARGRVIEIQAVGQDITDRKRAERAAQQSEARKAAILRAMPDLMFVMGVDGTYIDFHARDPKSLFVPPEAFLGKTIRDIMPGAHADRFMDAIARATLSEEPVVLEYELPIDGEMRAWETRIVSCESDKVLSIVRDITESRRARERNRDLAGRLLVSQEAERGRIARELHDDLSQKVALLNIDLDQLASPRIGEAERLDRLRQLSGRAGEIATGVHQLAHRLHPSKLQMLGLAPALRSVCREITEQHGVETDFAADESLPAIDPDVALCLYRVTQEALYNVLRHSGTRQASVELRCDGGGLTLRIADEGVGFHVDAAERAGLGLVSMRERVNLLGGTLTIQSAPGRGTWIVVSLSASLLGIHSKLA